MVQILVGFFTCGAIYDANLIWVIPYFMACLPQFGSVPAAYAVVAGGCDWPLPSAVGLCNNDVIALRPLRQFRYVRNVACVALDKNHPAKKRSEPIVDPRTHARETAT